MEAEREIEELRRLVERTQKEKDEKVKQVEMERDTCAREAEEWKKRAEKAEKEKEKHWNHIEVLNALIQGICLLKICTHC